MNIENPEFITKNIKETLKLNPLETIIFTNFLNNQTSEHNEIDPSISNELYQLSTEILTNQKLGINIGEYMDSNTKKLRTLYEKIGKYHNSI